MAKEQLPLPLHSMNSECVSQTLFLLQTLLSNKDQDKEGEGHTAVMETCRSPQSHTSCIFISTAAAEPGKKHDQPENYSAVMLEIKPV